MGVSRRYSRDLPQRHKEHKGTPSSLLFAPLRELFLLTLLLISTKSAAQTLYTVVLGNQNYVVGSSTLRSGLFVSYDGAATWKHIGPENLKAYSMDGVDTSNGRILYIAAGNGIHRSTDYGKSWKIVTDWRMTEVMDVKVDQTNPNFVYAATAFGFRRSTDGGETWENPEGELNGRYCYRFLRSFALPDLLLATDAGFYLSRDSGLSWTSVHAGKDCRGLWVIDSTLTLIACGDRTELREIPSGIRTVPLTQEWDSFINSTGTIVSFTAGDTPGPELNPRTATFDLALFYLNDFILATEEGLKDIVYGNPDKLYWYHELDSLNRHPAHALLYKGFLAGNDTLFSDDRALAGTFGGGLYWYEPNRMTPAGLPGSQVWRIIAKSYSVPEEVGHEH